VGQRNGIVHRTPDTDSADDAPLPDFLSHEIMLLAQGMADTTVSSPLPNALAVPRAFPAPADKRWALFTEDKDVLAAEVAGDHSGDAAEGLLRLWTVEAADKGGAALWAPWTPAAASQVDPDTGE